MSRTQIVEIGTIKRVHGVNGELQIALNANTQPNELNKLESVFIVVDAIPVPFFIETVRGNSPDMAIVKFDTIASANEAAGFVGLPVMAGLKRRRPQRLLSFDDLLGFKIINQNGVLVGEIIDYQEFSTNAVFSVRCPDGLEIMVPAAENLILEIVEETQTLILQVPEGLLDIYS